MRTIAFETRAAAFLLAVLPAILLSVLHTAPAEAQVGGINHTWVSHSGTDSNGCEDTSPCQTFSGALAQTLSGGEISCLDSGSFGLPSPLTITQSVTINCNGVVASSNTDVGFNCVSDITINAPQGVVTLRGLDIVGLNCGTNGIVIQAAAAVYIEDCTVENFSERGIHDMRTGGEDKLVIKNTVVRNNASTGITLTAAATTSVVLENVQSWGNEQGVAIATGSNVVISRSVVSQNTVTGIDADSGASVMVDNTEISHNGTYGILAHGNFALANSDIAFNGSSISGPTISYGNNRFFANGAGTAPTPAGAASTDFGQQ
jgi:hypothetical protein